jgi:hypothetical protein
MTGEPDAAPTHRVRQLIERIANSGLDVTPEDLAEALWLAGMLPPAPPAAADEADGAPAGTDVTASAGDAAGTPVTDPPATAAVRPPAAPLTRPPGAPLVGPPGAAPTDAVSLAIARALRPLRITTAAPRGVELDEEASAAQSAEARQWVPAFKRDRERWFDLCLVVDAAGSVRIWRRVVQALRGIAEQSGAFRTISVASVAADDDRPIFQVGQRCSYGPDVLVGAPHRRLVLIVSDCLAPWWRNGSAARALELLADQGPTAIVQVMPRRLWRRTGLGFVSVEFASPDPATPGAPWWVRPLDGEPPPGLPIPVVDLSPEPIEHLARLMSGRAVEPVHGAALYTRDIAAPVQPLVIDESAQELVRRFRESASPQALALARHLAATPLTMPLMRLVQRTVLPSTTEAQFAEVYLSGLLRRVEPSPDNDDASTEEQYEFREGVRKLLLAELPPADALAVLIQASRATPEAADFAATLEGDEPVVLPPPAPFATVAESVLRRLGGRYAALATRITAATAVPERSEVDPPAERPLWAEAAVRIAGALRRGPVVLRAGADARMLALDFLQHTDSGATAVRLNADTPALLRLSLRDLTAHPARHREQGRLLVLDAAGGPTEILPLLAHLPGRVLVLSDHPGWSAHGTVIEVATLDPDSADHLLARYSVPPARRAEAVAAAQGRPWLLDVIGRAWKLGGFDELTAALAAPIAATALPAAALEAYLGWLRRADPAATAALVVAAGFAAPPFAVATLVAAVAHQLGPDAGADPRRAVASLVERGLLDARSATGETRLPEDIRAVVRHATGVVDVRRGERAVLRALCDPRQRAAPSLSAHLEPFEVANIHDARARSALTAAIGRWLTVDDPGEALRLAEEAWLRRARGLGPGHPDTVRAELLLAWALLGEGRPAAAAQVFREAGRTLRRFTPARLNETASAASGIVAALGCMGDAAGARRRALRFHEQCRRCLPRHHPVRMRAARNLAAVSRIATRALTGRSSESVFMAREHFRTRRAASLLTPLLERHLELPAVQGSTVGRIGDQSTD